MDRQGKLADGYFWGRQFAMTMNHFWKKRFSGRTVKQFSMFFW